LYTSDREEYVEEGRGKTYWAREVEARSNAAGHTVFERILGGHCVAVVQQYAVGDERVTQSEYRQRIEIEIDQTTSLMHTLPTTMLTPSDSHIKTRKQP
jgi:hypothetical protein